MEDVRMGKELHKHICEDCFQAWNHSDARCSHGNVFICDVCAAVRRAQYDRGEAWAEMARNMPIPHDHKCIICRRAWGHNDKKCATEDHYFLECEACMTFTFTHPCPKCGTTSEEIVYGIYNVTRCVCPVCRYYFAPPGQEIYAVEENMDVCPQCGTHVTSDVCAKCGYHILLDKDSTDEYDAGVG